jgi:hypothetical protein
MPFAAILADLALVGSWKVRRVLLAVVRVMVEMGEFISWKVLATVVHLWQHRWPGHI